MHKTQQVSEIKRKKIQRSNTLSLQKIRERGEELTKIIRSSSLKTFIPQITKTNTHHPNKLHFSKFNSQISQKRLPYLNIEQRKSTIVIKKQSKQKQKQSNLKSFSKSKQIPQKTIYDKKHNKSEKNINQSEKNIKIETKKNQSKKLYILPKNTKKLNLSKKKTEQQLFQKEPLVSFQENYLDQKYLKKEKNVHNNQNYKTISENGILIFQNTKAEQFLTFQIYSKRLCLIQKLRLNPFFRFFKINKFLRLWKCYVSQKNKNKILKILNRKKQFSPNCIELMLKIRKYILKSLKLQQEWQYLQQQKKKKHMSIPINKYIKYMENKLKPILTLAKVQIFKQIIFQVIQQLRLSITQNDFQESTSSKQISHQMPNNGIIYEMYKQNLKKIFYMIQQGKVDLFCRIIRQIQKKVNQNLQFYYNLCPQRQTDALLNQIMKIFSIYQRISIIQQENQFSKINFLFIDHEFKITPFQIRLTFNTQNLRFQESEQFRQQEIQLTFKTIIDNLIDYFSKEYERVYDSQLISNKKKHYNLIQILIDFIQSKKISEKQYRVIQEAYNSIDQYNFKNLIQQYTQLILKLKNNINSTLIINFNSVKLIKIELQKVFYNILSDLLQSKQNTIASQYYLLLNKSLRILSLIPDYLRVGNFCIVVADANKKIIEYIMNIKKTVVQQTPLIYKQQKRILQNLMIQYDNSIQLSAWNFQNFIISYKALVQFKQKQHYIQNNKLPRIKNYLSLIHKTNPKIYEECFLQYIQLQRKFNDLKQKKYAFQQKITIKIKHMIPQKEILIKKTQNEIQNLQKEVLFITEIKEKKYIQNRNNYLKKIHNKDPILSQQSEHKNLIKEKREQFYFKRESNFNNELIQIKRIQNLAKNKQIIINDLQLFENLQIDHCIKTKKQIHFFSFQKLKKQLQYLIKLLESKIKFKILIQDQLKLPYRDFRIDYFLDLIQRQTLKIKHGNRILYQYQTFTIESFSYYQKFLSFLHILKIIKLLNEQQLKSIQNGKYFVEFPNSYTGQKILSFQLEKKQLYLQKLVQKKQFKENFSKIIQLLNNQIKSIKFQTQFDQLYEEQLFKNLEQLKIQIESIQDKIQTLKNNFQIQQKNIFIISEAVQKSIKSVNIIVLLIELQQLYINLKKMKGTWSTQQLIQQIQKQKIKFPIKRSQTKNQQQWLSLIKNYKNSYIQCIVQYNYEKYTKQMSTLKLNIQKQISFLKLYFQKKRDQFSYLYLFKDQDIITLALAPFTFYISFYDFIESAALSINETNFVGRLQTIYGQIINVPIQRQEKLHYEEQFSHNINLNLSLNKIHSDLKKLIFKNLYDLWKLSEQKLSKLEESKLPLSVIYIVDQLRALEKFKSLMSTNNSIELYYRIIEEEVQEIVTYFYNYKHLSVYQKNLYSTLLLSKLQLRQKLDFFNQERFIHFFTYLNKQNKFYLNCYETHHELCFNLVDIQDILIIEPITDKIMLNLINCFQDKTIGIVKEINSIKNISSRMLQDSKHIQKKHQFTIENLIKISTIQSIVFVIGKNNFQDQNLFFQLVRKTAQLFVQAKYKFFKLKNQNDQLHSSSKNQQFYLSQKNQQFHLSQKNQQFHLSLENKEFHLSQKSQQFHLSLESKEFNLPKIFFEYDLNQTNYQWNASKTKIRNIGLCLPSYSYLFDLYQVKFSINIPKDIIDIIKIKIKLQEQKSLKKDYVFSIKDYTNILDNLFNLFKINNDFDIQNIEEYFKIIQNEESQKLNKMLKNKQRKNKRSMLKKKKIFIKDQNTNYIQLIQLFNSIKKSLKLVQIYKQFHQSLNLNKPILLLGKHFLGKTTFYNNYFENLNNYSITQKRINEKITVFQKYQINSICFKVEPNLWSLDFQNIKNLQINSNNNQKLIIILKLASDYFPQQIQQIIFKKRITCGDQTMLLTSSIIIIETSQGQILSPNLIISSKILLFTQKTLQWEQIFLHRCQKILLFLNQKNQNQKPIQILTNSENTQKNNNPFQIFCLVLSDFFQDCFKKHFFQVNFSEKYIIQSTFTFFQCFINENLLNLQNQLSNLLQVEKKQHFLRKLFIYCFYWTCYWIVKDSLLKQFDISFRESLSKHDVNVRQIKFLNLMKVYQDKVEYYHIKSSSCGYIALQGFDFYMMYVDTYQTKAYKYFLSLLAKSQKNITIFGNSQVGKSSLVKSWFKENSKNNLIAILKSKKNLVQLNKKINSLNSNPTEQNILITDKNYKNEIQQKNLLIKIKECAYVLIDQMSLQTLDYHNFTQWLRQSSSIIFQKKYKKIQNVRLIIEKQLWTVQKNPSLAYHSYSLHIKFEQSYWQNVFQFIFQKIIRNKLGNQDDCKVLLKSKSFLIKNLFKFYKSLQKIKVQTSQTKGFLLIKQNFNIFTISQLKKSVVNVNKFQIKQPKQIVSYLLSSIENELKHRLQDSDSLQKFQGIFHRFKLSLADQILLNTINQFSVSAQTTILSENKNVLQFNDIEDVFMKKLQYQSNHKSIFISNEIIQNLHKFKYGFQNCSLIICNKLLILQKEQFPKFAAEWFNIKIERITSLSELQQKLYKKQKAFVFNDQLKKGYDQFQKFKEKQIKTQTSQIKIQNSIYFFPYSSNSQFLVKQFLQITKKITYTKKKNIQSIIQYSSHDQNFKNYLISSKLLLQSHIINLKVDSEASKQQKFFKLIYKNQVFDGDQNNCKHIINIFMKVYTNILKNLSQTFTFSYLSSSSNFQRICTTFIEVYFNKKVQLTSRINLISSGIGQFQNIKQEYSNKINNLRNLKILLEKSKIKLQAVKQQQKNIKQSINFFFSSQKYSQKSKKQKIIQRNNQQLNSLLSQRNNLKKQSVHYHNQINRNELAQLKYLYLNSFQSYKELFESLSLLVSGEQDSNAIKKNILDINLMQKLKEIDFSKRSSELINLIADKISKMLAEKQDKIAVTNISQWIYYSSLHQKSMIKYNQLFQELKKENQSLALDIIKIQSEANISQKQTKIKVLRETIQLFQQEITNLINQINDHQILLKLEPQIKNILEFKDSANQVKEQSKLSYDIILAESLFISFYLHFELPFIDQQNQISSDKKLIIKNYILDQINKRVIFQKVSSQQKLRQLFKNSIQNYLDFFFRKKIEFDYEDVLKRPIRRCNTKKKTNIRIEKNEKSCFYQKQQIKAKRRFTKQRNKKLKIINYLAQTKGQCIIIIDSKKQLLRLFNLYQVSKILISGDLSSRQAKSQEKEKGLNAYGYQQQFGQIRNNNIGYLVVQINYQFWEINLNKTKIEQKKYQVTIEIQKIKYAIQFQTQKACCKLIIIILKNKLSNLNQFTNQFQIIVLDDDFLHQRQLLRVQLMKWHLNSNSLIQNSQEIHSTQKKHRVKTKIYDQITNFVSGASNISHIFQQKLQCIKDMENIFKIIINKQKKFSIFDSQYLKQIHLLVEEWQKKKLVIQKLQNSNQFIKIYCKDNISQTEQKLFHIYQLYEDYLSLVQSRFNQFEKKKVHKNMGFDFFLSLVSQALEYINFKSNISTDRISQRWKIIRQQQSLNIKNIQQDIKLKVQQNLKTLQYYLIYRIWKQKHGLLFVALAYLKIYCLQNGEGSSIDIKNLFFECKLEQQIKFILNSKIGLNYVQIFQKFPAFKLQFELFVKKMMKNIYINQKLVQSDSQMNQFIQNFTYQNQLLKNQYQRQTAKNQLLKLSKFSKLILKKYFCENYFNKEISKNCQQLLQKCRFNLLFYNQFISSQKIQICFCDIKHQIVWIHEMFPNLLNNYEIIVLQQNQKFNSLNQYIVKIKNSKKPILIFDLRFKKQTKNNLNISGLQKQRKMRRIVSDFFDIHRKNCIIIADNSLHQCFHHYQISLNSSNKVICTLFKDLLINLLNSDFSVSYKKPIQETKKQKNYLITVKQIIRSPLQRENCKNQQAKHHDNQIMNTYIQFKQAYIQNVFMNLASILHINFQNNQDKLQNFIYLKHKIQQRQQRQLNQQNQGIKFDTFLIKQHLYLNNIQNFSLIQVGSLNLNLYQEQKNRQKLFQCEWTRVFTQRFNLLFFTQKEFKQKQILSLLNFILKSKLKLNAFLQQNSMNKLAISKKSETKLIYNNISSNLKNIQDFTQNQQNDQKLQENQFRNSSQEYESLKNQKIKEKKELLQNILIDKKQMFQKEQSRLTNELEEFYKKIKQLDSIKRKLLGFSEELYLKQKYQLSKKVSINQVILSHCKKFLWLLKVMSHIKLCKSTLEYFIQDYQNRVESIQIPFYRFSQTYFSLKYQQMDADMFRDSLNKLQQILIVSKGLCSNLNDLIILRCLRQQICLQQNINCTCPSTDYSFIALLQIKNKCYEIVTKFKKKTKDNFIQSLNPLTQLQPPQSRNLRRKTKISQYNLFKKNNDTYIIKIKLRNVQFLVKVQCQLLKSKLLNIKP